MTRPRNILFITSDQQRGDCYGFRGRRVRTPHLDMLAAGGTYFRNCITPSVVCQPARASILTGKLPFTNGVVDNGIDLDPAVANRGFAARLTDGGYQTALFGKAHFSTRATFEPTGTPENERSTFGPDWVGPYMGFEHVELTVLGKFFRSRPPLRPPHGQHYRRWLFEELGEHAYDLWASETRPGLGAHQTWSSGLPVAWHTSSWIGDRAINYLKSRDKSKPFCTWVSFPDPHHSFDCPEPWSSLHRTDEVDIAKHHYKDLDSRPWWHRASLEGEPDVDDPELKKYRKSGTRALDQTDDQLREMTANYYGMIALIDHNVGRLINALREEDLLDDTLIIFTSDHGDLLGDHGLYLKGPTPYEGLLTVGMIAAGCGVAAGREVVDPVSTLDLAATFAELGGVERDSAAQSSSLLPFLHEPTLLNGIRKAAYSEWFAGASRIGIDLELNTVRTETLKLTIEKHSGAGEMYDLEADPDEMRNVFDDARYTRQRDTLSRLIEDRPGIVLSEYPQPIGMA